MPIRTFIREEKSAIPLRKHGSTLGFNDDGKYNDCDVLRHRNVDKRMSVEALRGEVCIVQRAPVKMGIFEFHQGLEGASAVVVPDMRWVGRCERLSVDWFCQTLTTVFLHLKFAN